MWSILDTIKQQNLHLFTSDGSPSLFSSSLFCLFLTQRLSDLLQRKESQLNISTIGGNFARIQFSIVVHLIRKEIYIFVLGEQQPFCHKSDL
jgi:hypothetical protein